MMLGYFFVVLGIFLLLKAMGIIMASFWGYFWGIALVVLGFSMINKKSDRCCWGFWNHKKDHQHKDEGEL
ncbi:MAG: DUF5668 domain-containing protein [Patescibacteria group bacterium]